MSVRKCKMSDGSEGYKFGEDGRPYSSRAKAVAQGVATQLSKHDSFKMKVSHFDNAEVRSVHHCDLIKIDDDHGSMKINSEGFLQGDAPIARVGVMAYLMADGSILRELIGADQLFDQASMNTLKLKPVTNDHPHDRKITPENAFFKIIGSTGETITREDDFLLASMSIMEGDTLHDIEEGKQELSPGYSAELVFAPGEFEGEAFDAIQTNRIYNHVAIVDNARGGTEIRLQLDSAGCTGYEKVNKPNQNTDQKPNEKEKRMSKILINNLDYDAAPEVINHVNTLQAQVDSGKVDLKTKNDEFEKLKAEHDVLKAENEKLKNVDTAAEVQKAVASRIDLELVAHDVF